MEINYKNLIRQFSDFPKEGVLFQDINPLLSNWKALQAASEDIAEAMQKIMPFPTKILCVEARGFLLGGIVATLLNAGCVPVRKKGKLPPYKSLIEMDYDLEYGQNTICMDTSLIEYNDKIIIFDDVLATGGTAEATYRMLEQETVKGNLAPFSKENVCFAFLLEIEGLKGKKKLCERPQINEDLIFSLIQL